MAGFLNTLFKSRQTVKNAVITNSTVVQVGGDIIDENLLAKLGLHKSDRTLLNRLVIKELASAESFIIEGKTKDASSIIDTINAAHVKSLDDEVADALKYLKSIICLLNNDVSQAEALAGFIGDDSVFRCNIDMLVNIEKSGIGALVITDRMKNEPLLSYILLQVLFRKMEWQCIISNFEPSDDSTHIQDFFFALSTLNNFRFDEAVKAFDMSISKKPESKYILCGAIAQVNHIMSQVAENRVERGSLKPVFDTLVEYGKICAEFVESNPTVFYFTKLRALISLDLDAFYDEYNQLPQALNENTDFKVLLAAYYQGKKRYDEAIVLYKRVLSEGMHEEVFYRIMLCLLLQDKFAEIISFYEAEVEKQLPVSITIYLIAIGEHIPKRLDELFNKYYSDRFSNVDDMLHLVDVCRYSTHVKEVIYASVKEHKEHICKSSKLNRIHAGFFSMQANNKELGYLFFASIDDYTVADLEIVYAMLRRDESIGSQETITEWFVDNNFTNAPILSILAECYMKKEKHYSAFNLLQKSFAIEQHMRTAVVLINLAAMIDTVKLEDIQLYLDFVANEKEPDILLIVAQTMCKFGLYDKAMKLAYESLYLLENREDKHIIGFCLHIHFKMIIKFPNRKINHDRVKDDVVVTLVSSETNCENTLTVCIHQEETLGSGIEAIGVKHLPKTDLLYLRLANKERGSNVEYDGKTYEIKEINDKYVHAFWYVCGKSDDSGTDFEIITVDVNDDVVQQMKKAMEKYGPNHNLLDSYYALPFGLPIECVNNSAYDDYVHIVQHLLFSKDEALYAGINGFRFNSEHSYTASLSALVVLKIQEQLHLLEELKDRIYIPSTLLTFIKERSENSSQALVNSPGKLLFTDEGKGVIIPTDETMPNFWNSIYEYALKLKCYYVTADDRNKFNKLCPIDLEEVFVQMKIHVCQMDAFITAKKSNTILISDDLFYRHLAGQLGIISINHIHLYHTMDTEKHIEAHLKLVKTNYLYALPIMGDPTYLNEYIDYISNNERKRKAYSELFLPKALSFDYPDDENLSKE